MYTTKDARIEINRLQIAHMNRIIERGQTILDHAANGIKTDRSTLERAEAILEAAKAIKKQLLRQIEKDTK